MVGKLTAVLIRKEAEAYRAQGLHEEAFALYDELLSSSPNIDEALRTDIQIQMDAIAEEMEAVSNRDEEKLLSSKEIRQLKDGWDKGASARDMLVSAQDLCQIGAYQDALIELAKLLEGGIAPDNVAEPSAECFVNLCDPKKLPATAEKWLRGIYSDGKKVLAVHLLIIKALSRRQDKTHAMYYCRYIRSKSGLPSNLKDRLDEAVVKFKADIKQAKERPESIPAGPNKNNKLIRKNDLVNQKVSPTALGKKLTLPIAENDNSSFIAGPMESEAESEDLKQLFMDTSDDQFDEGLDEDPPALSHRKKGRLQLHFFRIIILGWIQRFFKRSRSRRKH